MQGMQESQTEKDEMTQQQRMKVMTDMTKKNRIKRQNGREQKLVGQRAAAADCQKAWLHPGQEDAVLQWRSWLCED